MPNHYYTGQANINYYSEDYNEECEVVVDFDYEPYDEGDRDTPPCRERFNIRDVNPLHPEDISKELAEEIKNLNHEEYGEKIEDELKEAV